MSRTIAFERLIPCIEKTKSYRPALNTALRYVFKGLNGEKLRAEKHGSMWMTSEEWVNDFYDRATRAELAKHAGPEIAQPKQRSEKARAKAIEKAERDLARV